MREEMEESQEAMMAAMDKAEAPEVSPSTEMESGEVCVPLKVLEQPDDEENMQTPEEGDNVSMTVDAIVTRIEGDNAYLKPVSINGTDLQAEKEENNEGDVPADVAEGNALRDEASKMSDYA